MRRKIDRCREGVRRGGVPPPLEWKEEERRVRGPEVEGPCMVAGRQSVQTKWKVLASLRPSLSPFRD